MRLVFLFLYFLFILNFSFSQDKIIAVVNGEAITQKELKDYLNLIKFRLSLEYKDKEKFQEEFKKEKSGALERLIEDRLIVQEAKKEKIEIPQELIDAKINEFISSFKNREDFEDSLRKRGSSISSLKKKIKEQLLMRKIINEKVKAKIEVTPYQITDYYNKHLQEFRKSASVKYRALKFPSQLQAYQVFEELKKSKNMEATIAKYPSNLVKGSLNKSECRKELEEIFEVKEDGFSSPLKIEKEFYIFIIDKKIPAKVPILEEVKDKIWNIVYQKKFKDRLNTWLKTLKEKAVIKKNTNLAEISG